MVAHPTPPCPDSPEPRTSLKGISESNSSPTQLQVEYPVQISREGEDSFITNNHSHLSAWLFLRSPIQVLQLSKVCSRSYILVDFLWAGFGRDHERRDHSSSPQTSVLASSLHLPRTYLFFPFPPSHTAFEQPPSAQCVSNCSVRVTFRFTVLEEIAWIWIHQNTKFNQP